MPNVAQAPYQVCAFYQFIALVDIESLQKRIRCRLLESELCGTVLLAHEGINGTVAGKAGDTHRFFQWLQAQLGLSTLDVRKSWCKEKPFKRTKVKLKKEIVALGVDGVAPSKQAGTYVNPENWNALVNDPEVLLIDARNDYEVEIGRFRGAISPDTASFREFPDYVKNHLDPNINQKIAMYCTGGIRCEKASAYLKQKGFNEVFQLQGGILNYLEHIPKDESCWDGECFVFDDRTTLDETLASGAYEQCHACRRPINRADKQSSQYRKGVSCPKCYDQKSDRDRFRYAEREKQTRLSKRRGEVHIGPDSLANPDVRDSRKNRSMSICRFPLHRG